MEGIDLKEETLEGNTDNTNLMVVDGWISSCLYSVSLNLLTKMKYQFYASILENRISPLLFSLSSEYKFDKVRLINVR